MDRLAAPLAFEDPSAQPNFNTLATTGGLSRSSRTDSLAILANGGPASKSHSPSSSSGTSPTTAHSSFSATGTASTSPSSAPTPSRANSGFIVTSRTKSYQPPPSPNTLPSPLPSTSTSASASPPWQPSNLSHTSSLNSRRGSPPLTDVDRKPSQSSSKSWGDRTGTNSPPAPGGEPKTTLHLSSSIDSQGRRMVNQYVRLKTIGQGSHGKVWLCAEPSVRDWEEDEDDEDDEDDDPTAPVDEDGLTSARRRRGKRVSERWEQDIEAGEVRYCAIKSVAREGGRGKSLRQAKGKKASQTSGGIGADDKVKREVAIMKRLDHPNIVRLKEVIDDVKSKKVFMVLEFMAGGQIEWQDDNKLPTMTVDEARRTFRDVVLGLEYLHYQGIIHRDIKPANLLWTEDHSTVKISDFGVSHVSEALLRACPDNPEQHVCENDDKALRKTAGSPAFFAPELCHPSEYTPTPSSLTSASSSNMDGNNYFPLGAQASPSSSSNNNTFALTPPVSTPTTSGGVTLSSTVISKPLPPVDPTKPRVRPTVGKGIDVWALGVTLYCLLFGDTPFMARTEYELYNVIVREGIRVPERMGREGQWTGQPGPGADWEGRGDGVEGREVIDLLAKLLQKDPAKRIGLDDVKKHPWVLRNLSSSPDSWLCDTDPAQSDAVVISAEEIEHATQERGAIDSLPPIRTRPGFRRALNAALVRFPAFARIKSTSTRGSDSIRRGGGGGAGTRSSGRSRSKSASSTSQSHEGPVYDSYPTSHAPSRHVSEDATMTTRKKNSVEFGVDLRRMLSRETSQSNSNSTTPAAHTGPHSRSSSPAGTIGGRGGWGNYSKHSNLPTPDLPLSPRSPNPNPSHSTPLPELSRTTSATSVGKSSLPHHLFASSRKNSDFHDLGGAPLAGSTTPSSESSESATGRRGLSKMLSRFAVGNGGGRGKAPIFPSRKSSLPDPEDDVSASELFGGKDALPAGLLVRERYDALGRVIKSPYEDKIDDDGQDIIDEDDVLDLTEFEYSESEDDDDSYDEDFIASPISQADSHSGWHSSTFAPFSLASDPLYATVSEVRDEDTVEFKSADSHPPRINTSPFSTTTTIADESTPRAASQHPPYHLELPFTTHHTTPSSTPPPLVRESSASPTRPLNKLSINPTAPHPPRSSSLAGSPILDSFPSSPTGGSRAVSADPSSNKSRWANAAEDDDDNDCDDGIFLAPRRRRAHTLNTNNNSPQ